MESILDMIEKYYLIPTRYLFVFIVILIFIQIKRLMLFQQERSNILVVLDVDNGHFRIPITHYEMTIGRSDICDVIINFPSISRQHAVLTMNNQGYWKIADTKSKGGILVNGKLASKDTMIAIGDQISLAGIDMVFTPANYKDAKIYEQEQRNKEKSFTTKIKQKMNFIGKKEGNYNFATLLLNIFQLLAFVQLYFTVDKRFHFHLSISFFIIMITPRVFKLIARALDIQNLGAEMAAFFLTTIGLCTTASASPSSLIKQIITFIIGIVFYCFLCTILKKLDLIMKLRRYAAIGSILILILNLLIGSNINGQINWIRIGMFTIQPSELVKVFFIFASSTTLEWLLTNKNLRNLIIYSVTCVGLLVLMGDFGTALIFFFTFIILMFMTSGDLKAISLTIINAILGLFLAISFRPYIIRRFNTWRNVWVNIFDSGSQQARALIALGSGGLLGIGAGNGFSKNLFAADTDIVIAMIAEEWGLIISFIVSLIYLIFIISSIRSHRVAMSSYYLVAACATASLFLFQAALNIFGTVDVLPFTGVTLPFVSNGGSSMIGSWGLLSFITASLNYARPKINKASTPVKIRRG
jgi:Bacterial cell division membrane protein